MKYGPFILDKYFDCNCLPTDRIMSSNRNNCLQGDLSIMYPCFSTPTPLIRLINALHAPLQLMILVVACVAVHAQSIPARVTKVKPGLIRLSNEIPYSGDRDNPSGKAALVFDDQYAFVASPGGLYRTALPITSQSAFTLIGFENRNIYNLYVNNGSLYVLKESIATQGREATDHSFLRSDDHGATFVPMDYGLQECLGDYCEFLAPSQAIFKTGLIFINAGAGNNLFVTANNGSSWTPLLGSFDRKLGNWQAFELMNDRMMVGGEALDQGYLQRGTLRADMLGWKQAPTDATSPSLTNRGPLVLKNKPNSSEVYVAVPAGLLKSTDAGQTFRFVMAYPMANSPAPNITDVLFPSRAANVVVVAGRDPDRPFLAYSKDNGETWLDNSAKVRSTVSDPGSGVSCIDFLSEDSNGEIFAGVVSGPTHSLTILRLQFNSAMFR